MLAKLGVAQVALGLDEGEEAAAALEAGAGGADLVLRGRQQAVAVQSELAE